MKKNFKTLSFITTILLSLVISLQGCSSLNDENSKETSATRTITDLSGRNVDIPTNVTKAFGANPMSSILLYTVAPDTMIGWNTQLPNIDLLPDKYKSLPNLGSIETQKEGGNVEEVIKSDPQIILLAKVELNDKAKESADSLSEKTGKPVILIDGSLNGYENTYKLLGDIFNNCGRADELINYYKTLKSTTLNVANTIDDSQKLNVYYGRSSDGLETGGKKSAHTLLLEMVGAKNPFNSLKSVNTSRISIEELLSKDIDVILLSETSKDEKGIGNTIKSNPQWANIKAVQNSRVYVIPQLVFSWFDRPPTINQLVGIKWLQSVLYPEKYNIDINKEVKEFYKLFYYIDLPDDKLNEVLKQ